jgi:DNA-binding transcriptional LysR family regulator
MVMSGNGEWQMHSRLLQSFLVVSEKSNITEAAAALNVSQPALTKSIHRLEEELNVQLFERVATGVRLTPFGEVLQHHARVMENEYRHAVARIDSLRDGRAEELRIGAGPVWLVSILPPVIAKFQQAHAGIKISLIGGTIDTLVPALVNADLDIICVSLDFPNRPEIVKQPLCDVRHVLVAHSSHPLSSRSGVEPSSLSGFPWLVLKSDYVGTERIFSYFAANGLKPPHIAMETTSIHSLLETLRNGEYIAHIPEQMIPIARANGLERIDITGKFWETTAGIAYRSTSLMTGPLNRFIKQLQTTEML